MLTATTFSTSRRYRLPQTRSSPAQIEAAIRQQIEKIFASVLQRYTVRRLCPLLLKLNALAGKFAKKTLLVTVARKAVENASKCTGTPAPAVSYSMMPFMTTLMTLSLTSKTHPYKAGFEPFGVVYRLPYAYCYRCFLRTQISQLQNCVCHVVEDAFKRVWQQNP